ncbi:hypothetical protein Tco_1398241 [Tanacetum coccineum]
MVPRKILTRKVNTARPKAVVNAVKINRVNVVKSLACWVWRPVKANSASITLKRYDYIDARGRSRLHGKLMLIENITSEVNAIEKIIC